ncbi:hypothetical protein RvY_10371 [Ramazzottius varieornatus]|uniref:Uncharacterized protein n=1 Tax=Ramazzottius varieornatus TaxID=947166 RepID=A0A1D1VCJ0_RAMVA|nr:hypothetical protein RvY_10371 [Ramazzottius varieornatus]
MPLKEKAVFRCSLSMVCSTNVCFQLYQGLYSIRSTKCSDKCGNLQRKFSTLRVLVCVFDRTSWQYLRQIRVSLSTFFRVYHQYTWDHDARPNSFVIPFGKISLPKILTCSNSFCAVNHPDHPCAALAVL